MSNELNISDLTNFAATLQNLDARIEEIETRRDEIETELEVLLELKQKLEPMKDLDLSGLANLTSPAQAIAEGEGTKREKAIKLLAQGMSVKDVSEQLGAHVGYIRTIKRDLSALSATTEITEEAKAELETKAAKKADGKSTKANGESKAAKATTTEAKPKTQREKITELLEQGVKPAQIAKTLNTNVSYVYTVKNS